MFQYDDDEATTTERFTGDGALLSRRIHGGGTAGYTMLHFTPDGATPVGVEGVVPGLPQFDWGPTRDGLSCAAVVTPRSGPIERIVIHVSLLNRSEDTLPIGWGPASVEARPSLFDADGRQVPIPPAIREAQRLEQEANGGLRFGSAIAPGSARYSRHRLATWYPELPPGDYRLVLERVGQGVGQFVRCPGLEWTVEASAR